MSEASQAARLRGVETLDGIVVGRLDVGEQDRVIRWLTPTRGLVATFARGARRPRSPFAAADIGTRARLDLRHGRGGLPTLVRVEVSEARVRLRTDYHRLLAALHACEVVGGLAPPDHPEPRLFGLLETALLLLDHADAPPRTAFAAALEAKALSFAGLTPRLDRCVACGRAPEPEMAWVPAGGGLFHRNCVPAEVAPPIPVAADFAAALERGRRAPLREVYDQDLPAGPADLLASSLAAFHGRPLRGRAG